MVQDHNVLARKIIDKIHADATVQVSDIAFLVGMAASEAKYEERSRVLEIVRNHIGGFAMGSEYLEDAPCQVIRELYEGIEDAVAK